jgi:hypothetical protein
MILTCGVATAVLAAAPVAHALRSIPARTDVTNGPVHAVAVTPGAIYIGGDFTQVGPRTGPGVGIDSSTGKSKGFAEIAGGDQRVFAAARDGSGGFYVGGNFTYVDGVARRNLAHILADGTVDRSFQPNPNRDVRALAVSGSTVYAGGEFTSIGGQSRNYIAALDAATGAATGWNPHANSFVLSLAVSGSTVYAGGQFTRMGGFFGQSRNYIAALDATTGAATSWNPNANSFVLTLAASGSTVYAGGQFNTIGGKSRNYIAALNATTGAATAWDPSAGGAFYPWVRALAVSGSTVYAGGDFTSIGGQNRNHLAALDRTTGQATSWNPAPNKFSVGALAVTDSSVYVGGDFTFIGGKFRSYIAALDPSTGSATGWRPNANHPAVLALAVSGSTVYAGGEFSSIGGQSRRNLAALDPTTGAVTSWNPGANSGVRALRVSGSTVYAGGEFTSVGGQSRNHIAALDATTGAATNWNPNANSTVRELRVSGSTVYAGGDFTSIGGKSRNHLAALDASTGAATSWDPSPNGQILALRVSGSTVYAGGSFSSIGGQPRNAIAALKADTGAATAWDPNANLPPCEEFCLATPRVGALAVSGSTVYAGGFFTSIGGQNRNGLAALDAGTGAATGWDPNPSGSSPSSQVSVDPLALSGSTVYVGGSFSSIGGQARAGLAGLDAATGAATSWNPRGDHVSDLAVGLDGSLWAGGNFNRFWAVPQEGIARFKP